MIKYHLCGNGMKVSVFCLCILFFGEIAHLFFNFYFFVIFFTCFLFAILKKNKNKIKTKHNFFLFVLKKKKEEYYGAAHGVSGILSAVCNIPSIRSQNQNEIIQMLDYCQTFKFRCVKTNNMCDVGFSLCVCAVCAVCVFVCMLHFAW